jgi:hypothetical protein
MPKAIATPPKYGTGSVCVFLAKFGLSMAPKRIARARIGQVNKPVNAKAAIPKIAN